jgi:hypothetical protein
MSAPQTLSSQAAAIEAENSSLREQVAKLTQSLEIEKRTNDNGGWTWIRQKLESVCPEFRNKPRTDSLVGTKWELMGWMHIVCHHAVAGYRTYLDIAVEQQKRAEEAEAELEFIKTGEWPKGFGPKEPA